MTMKQRLTLTVSVTLSIILVFGPLFALASPGSAKLKTTPEAGNSRPTSRPTFVSKLLGKRPSQNASALDVLPGQTSTILQDGRLLKVGGLGQDGPVASIVVENSRSE